ncbi:unnamed protein product [Soboliphyme baturini]|uniref:LRRNT domain-containing protein n=1 Tax=Soboliphyme baturini TaxID=241478 RepID=A0A183J3S1_9BILA|nr:unnamed protein product [Soboliphyme baturini]
MRTCRCRRRLLEGSVAATWIIRLVELEPFSMKTTTKTKVTAARWWFFALLAALAMPDRCRGCSQAVSTLCMCSDSISGITVNCVDKRISDVVKAIGNGPQVIELLQIHQAREPNLYRNIFSSLSIRRLDLSNSRISQV